MVQFLLFDDEHLMWSSGGLQHTKNDNKNKQLSRRKSANIPIFESEKKRETETSAFSWTSLAEFGLA